MSKLKIKKKQKPVVFAVLAVLAILVFILGFYTMGLRCVDRNNTESVTVSIPTGTGASQVAYILDDAGLVRNSLCAKVNVRIGGYNSLQANTYVFNKSMSFPEMMRAINEGDFEYISKKSVNIVAGYRIPQVAEDMAKELPYTKKEIINKWSDKKFLKELIGDYWFLTNEILDDRILYPLEGYFYADTYFITDENSTLEGATRMFLDRMDQELEPRKDEINKSGFTVHEFLTMTSIVTKEGGDLDNDLPKVAGVFMNRLKKKMSLGSDVTVNYIYQEDKVNLKQSQLDNDSPYNTRKHAGLPPSPICAVLDTRMDAVLNYEKTDYLFFYGCPDGTVIFSKTQAEHDKAAAENPWPEDK